MLTATSLLIGLLGSSTPLFSHPADVNGDSRLDLGEMTAYVSAWEQGENWQGSPIEDDFAWQAVRLWRQGEHYRAEPGPPEPFIWVPNPANEAFVALENSRPQPMDRVPIHGLPADGEAVAAQFTVMGYPGEYIARVVQDSDGAPALIVPINPFDLNGGGELLFTFTSGEQEWRAGPVGLKALDPAPQAMHSLRDSVRTWLVDFGTSLDADLPALLSVPVNELPAGLLPPVALLHEIEGPQVANNLNALLVGSAPILDGEAIDLDLFERLAAKLGAAERLPGILVSQDEPVPAASAWVASSLGANGSSGHSDRIDIQDGLDLAEAMQQQKTAEDTLKGLEAGDEILEDLESNLGEADSALETLTSLPGADTNAIGMRQNQIQSVTRASNYVGWFLRAVEFINYYNAGVLPSRFDALAVSVRRPDGSPWIYEDDCSPAPVSALATVSSNSVEYGAEESFLPEDLQQTALPEILPSFQRDIPTGTVTFGPAGVSVEGEWVPAFTWPDIEVAIGNLDNSDSMVEVNVREPDLPFKGQPRSAQGSSQIIGSEVVPEVAAYVGVTGTATIEVAPKPVYFGGKTIERTAPYQLRALNPLIFDYPQFITPGDPILIRASLTADKQGLEQIEWQITDANGVALSGYMESMPDESAYLLELAETPEENDAYPLKVVFRSVTEACLRGSENAPPRESQVMIESAGFDIDPAPSCLAEGDEWIFFAVWPGGEAPEHVSSVNWTIESGGGSLSVEGPFTVRYTAPASSGQIILKAENADDPNDFATATFRVGCSLGSTLWFDGATDFPPSVGTIYPDAIRMEYFDAANLRDGVIEAAGPLTITTVEFVAGYPGYSVAEGTFSAWGLALEENGLLWTPETYDQLVDDSGNSREYAMPGPADETYTLSASINGSSILIPGERIRMNTANGRLELDFGGGGSTSGLTDGEIVSYAWSTSSGQSSTEENPTLEFPAEPGLGWVQLIVTDNLGNTARQLVRLRFVYVEASFAFDYRDDGFSHISFPFETGLPVPIGSSFLHIDVVGHPFSGSATTGGSATSAGLLEVEEEGSTTTIFRIQYQPEFN